MKKRMIITLLAVVTMTSLLFVGCGGKGTATDNSTETVTETNVAEVETSTQEESNSQEVITETEAVAETETPTEEPTPTPEPTEEPTPKPTETPTPEHEHSYTETIITEGTCTSYGTKLYSCACGYSYEKEYCLDHVRDNNRVIIQEASCLTGETTAEHCIYCGMQMYNETDNSSAGHTPWNYWIYHHGTGTYRRGCERCGVLLEETSTRPEGVEIRDFYPYG